MKAILCALLLSVALGCSNNCYDCDPSATVCFACAQGFELSVLGTCVDSNTVAKCDLYGPTNQCFACQPTFTITNGQCLKDYSACLAYDPSDDSKCITCGFGTTLRNGACAGAINCNTSNNAGNCTACLPGFRLDRGNCVDNTGNCARVGTNGVCITCNSGFSLVGYSCLPANQTVYGCYVFDASGVCELCKAGYNIYQGNCLLPSQIQQILQGITQLSTILAQRSTVSVTTTTTTTTTTMAAAGGDFGSGFSSGFGSGFGSFGGFDNAAGSTGFGGDSFGGSSFGGSSFGGSSFGGSSFGGSSFGGSSTTSTTTTNNNVGGAASSLPIANCQAYSAPGVCQTCNTGFITTGSACVQVSVFCASYNLQTGVCLTCNYGFPLQNGQCNDPNCLAQTAAGCSSCRTGFALNANSFCQLNDRNCAQVAGSVCLQCIAGFYVGAAGLCVALPANCAAVNAAFACSRCNSGFQLSSSGACVAQSSTVTTVTTSTTTASTITIPFCAAQSGLICSQCLPGYQLSNNQCVVVLIANCQIPDPARPNQCLTCLTGFTLNNGACVQTQSPSTPFCQSYNLLTGQCIACISGYSLSGSNCVVSTSGSSSITTTTTTTTGSSSSSSSGGVIVIGGNRDPNCARYNGTACAQCSNRYYFGTNNLCVPVNPLCNLYHPNGSCQNCFPGYTISGGNCIVSRQTDPFCKSFSQGGICTACYGGYFYNQAQAACQPLNPLCRTSNLTDGTCLSCFPGYSLNAGICAVSFQDPNCQKWDTARSVCTQCSTRFYVDASGKCRQINPLCRTADNNTGACLSCFPGYVLSGTACVMGGASNSDVNCQTVANGLCQKCYSGYFLDSTGKCRQNNPLCKTSDAATGNCNSCWPGYVLAAGNCSLSSSATSSGDPNCKATDQSGVCTGCYSGYFLTAGMSCQKVDPLCKTYTAALSACASCYDGYTLSGTQCLLSTQAASANSDPYCIASRGANCVTCANGYYLPPTGACAALNPLCRESDNSTGACLSCYPGYALSGTTCIVAAAVSIPYCSQTNGNVCVACIQGYYVSAGQCALVNVLCATYDLSNGNCLSCVPGYVFQASQCILPSLGIDPNCLQYANSYCTQCSSGFALINYWCSPIDPNCLQYNPTTNVCSSCSQGRTPMGPSCI